MTTSFKSIGVPEPMVRELARLGITAPFPIQAEAIPDALDGRDVAGKAPTGSGKTLAFGIPMLIRAGEGRKRRPAALVLAPTRELAEQIKNDLTPLAGVSNRKMATVYGGVPYGRQRTALNQGVDILVATPGRLEDLCEQGMVDLGSIGFVVIDEADRMADMGFLPAVRRIMDQTSSGRQTLLFSATLDGDIAVLVSRYQDDPVRHEAGSVESPSDEATHLFWSVPHHDRVAQTADIVKRSGRSIVFTRTRRGADRLVKQLAREGVEAASMHGGRSQNQRQRALRSFAGGKFAALVATDVAARGIHIDAVDTVIHYDPASDHKDYVHRSGRTARAGEGGTVVSLVTGEKRKAVDMMRRKAGVGSPIGKPQPELIGRSPGRRSNRPAREHVEAQDSGSALTVDLFVGNLPWSTSGDDLDRIFSRHGRVTNTSVMTDRRGRSKGYGFVEMSSGDATAAMSALEGSNVGGRRLKVRTADPKRPMR